MVRSNLNWGRIAGVALLTVVGGTLANAGTFSVNPVRIDFSPQRPTAIVQVANLTNEPATVQVHVVRWTFDHDHEVYLPTDEVLLNPPIFTLRPNQKQVMRLGLRQPNSSSTEVAYRLILEEVPKRPAPGFVGLQTVLRISIPVFAQPAGRVAPSVVWLAERTTSGALKITASNRGNAHIRIRELQVATKGTDHPTVSKMAPEYLLPGQSQTWTIEDKEFRDVPQIALIARTDTGEIDEVLGPITR